MLTPILLAFPPHRQLKRVSFFEDVSNIDQHLVRCRRHDGFDHRPTWHLTVTESVALPPDLGRSIMPEIQPMGNDTLFRVVVLVLGTIPVALVAAAVLISPP